MSVNQNKHPRDEETHTETEEQTCKQARQEAPEETHMQTEEEKLQEVIHKYYKLHEDFLRQNMEKIGQEIQHALEEEGSAKPKL